MSNPTTIQIDRSSSKASSVAKSVTMKTIEEGTAQESEKEESEDQEIEYLSDSDYGSEDGKNCRCKVS